MHTKMSFHARDLLRERLIEPVVPRPLLRKALACIGRVHERGDPPFAQRERIGKARGDRIGIGLACADDGPAVLSECFDQIFEEQSREIILVQQQHLLRRSAEYGDRHAVIIVGTFQGAAHIKIAQRLHVISWPAAPASRAN